MISTIIKENSNKNSLLFKLPKELRDTVFIPGENITVEIDEFRIPMKLRGNYYIGLNKILVEILELEIGQSLEIQYYKDDNSIGVFPIY